MNMDISYEQLILEGIRGLPADVLSEIVNFVYFMRQRTIHPQRLQSELYQTLLPGVLSQLNRNEMTHLEEEFADYATRYPRE